jgi:hypothetical protein
MKKVSESMEAMASGGLEARSSRDASAAEAEVLRAESMSRLLAQARKLSSDIRVAEADSEDTFLVMAMRRELQIQYEAIGRLQNES